MSVALRKAPKKARQNPSSQGSSGGGDLLARSAPKDDVLRELLEGCADEVATDLNLEIVELKHARRRSRALVRVVIDSDEGVSLGDCARFSKEFGGRLEDDDRISFAYELEVSSPGATRPFAELRHYLRNVGEYVRIQLKDPIDKRAEIMGRLVHADEDAVRVEPDEGGELTIPMSNIQKAARAIRI